MSERIHARMFSDREEALRWLIKKTCDCAARLAAEDVSDHKKANREFIELNASHFEKVELL
jgi:hypothetical protein